MVATTILAPGVLLWSLQSPRSPGEHPSIALEFAEFVDESWPGKQNTTFHFKDGKELVCVFALRQVLESKTNHFPVLDSSFSLACSPSLGFWHALLLTGSVPSSLPSPSLVLLLPLIPFPPLLNVFSPRPPINMRKESSF